MIQPRKHMFIENMSLAVSVDNIINNFFRCSYSQFDPVIHEGPKVMSELFDTVDGTGPVTNLAAGKGYYGIRCRCQMSPVRCVPSDSFVPVIHCDATGSQVYFLVDFVEANKFYGIS